MLSIIFDTNIYEKIALDGDAELIAKILRKFHVLNFVLIKKEIQRIPRDRRLPTGRKAKALLTTVYNSVARGGAISESSMIKRLAEEYFSEFRKLGGNQAKSKIITDFKIVACASLNKLQIIVSDDERTMKSSLAQVSYLRVNVKYGLALPKFIDFRIFKSVLSSD